VVVSWMRLYRIRKSSVSAAWAACPLDKGFFVSIVLIVRTAPFTVARDPIAEMESAE